MDNDLTHVSLIQTLYYIVRRIDGWYFYVYCTTGTEIMANGTTTSMTRQLANGTIVNAASYDPFQEYY